MSDILYDALRGVKQLQHYVRESSKEAYRDIQSRIGDQQQLIVDQLLEWDHPANLRMLAEALDMPSSTVSGRVNELKDEGILVELDGKADCPYTGRKTLWYRLTLGGDAE